MDFLAILQFHANIGLWILGLMTALWIISLILKDSSIVDIFWGAGFVMSAWVAFIATLDNAGPRDWLMVFVVTIWGLRLSIHILIRNWGKGEDFRYVKMREDSHGQWWWQSFFKVFLLQGILMWLVATPISVVQMHGAADMLGVLDYIAVVLWVFGFFFEAVGDAQLSRFKANSENKGKVLTSGVWRYTRHPNYFGDSAQWWAFYLLAVAAGGWWSIFSPIIMTLLLIRVSGVALLEKSLSKTKPGYEEYQQRTSAFIPWFPKRGPLNKGDE
jgi:steroid 5-alpha reductase family enzyme